MPEEQHGNLDLSSMDIAAQKRQELKQLFPEVFTETTREDGTLAEAIDFERLKSSLGEFSEILERKRERYGMVWSGKNECQKIIQQPSLATLKPDREESVNFDQTENLFIEGDNLEVLKLLQKSYYGKVKMIYIDPPYNTGNDFVYPDDYSESLDTYLKYAGLSDKDGKKWESKVNSKDSARFHTQWMNMMYPRLYLARNLLRDDGVILISIDENEFCNLRIICNEIFGEENLLGVFLWKRRQRADSRNQTNVSFDHEYILAYSSSENSKFRGKKIDTTKYKNPDNDPRGSWASIDLTGLATANQRPNLHYEIIDPKTGKRYPPNPSRGWSKSRNVIEKMIEDGRILFPASDSGRPREKKFLKELQSIITGFSTCLNGDEAGYTTNGTREVTSLFGAKFFDFPKPTKLLSLLCNQIISSGDVILDFFSGSASIAQAEIETNIQDRGNRKYIIVQLPESCPEDSEAAKAGFKTIADIGKERIRRVIKKIKSEQDGELDHEGKPKPDLGFKVFKLDRSNFKVWDSDPKEEVEAVQQQLKLHIDHIDPESSQEDILYELLLKSGFPLTTSIEKQEMTGKDVYSIEDGALLICLEKSLTPELIRAMADTKPLQVICLDEGFEGNDQLKTNAVQTFKSRSHGESEHQQIIFRTV